MAVVCSASQARANKHMSKYTLIDVEIDVAAVQIGVSSAPTKSLTGPSSWVPEGFTPGRASVSETRLQYAVIKAENHQVFVLA